MRLIVLGARLRRDSRRKYKARATPSFFVLSLYFPHSSLLSSLCFNSLPLPFYFSLIPIIFMATRGGRGRGVGGPVRGGIRGGAPLRGGPPANGSSHIASHVEAIGVKRPGFGVQGKVIEVNTNHFACSIPETKIHHYDGSSLSLVQSLSCLSYFM